MNLNSSPYLEQSGIFNSINFDWTYDDPSNTTVSVTPLSYLYCPSEPAPHIDDATMGGTGLATTSYGTSNGESCIFSVNWNTTPRSPGPKGRKMFGPNTSRTIASVTDGLSNTIY